MGPGCACASSDPLRLGALACVRYLSLEPGCPARRLIMVESVKWVDEVIPRVPYDVSETFMNELFEARLAYHEVM